VDDLKELRYHALSNLQEEGIPQSRDVQAKYVMPCTGNLTSCISLNSILFQRIKKPLSGFLPSCPRRHLAIMDRVAYLDHTASSVNQTVHFTSSSPKGKENMGMWPEKASLRVCNGVVFLLLLKNLLPCHVP